MSSIYQRKYHKRRSMRSAMACQRNRRSVAAWRHGGMAASAAWRGNGGKITWRNMAWQSIMATKKRSSGGSGSDIGSGVAASKTWHSIMAAKSSMRHGIASKHGQQAAHRVSGEKVAAAWRDALKRQHRGEEESEKNPRRRKKA